MTQVFLLTGVVSYTLPPDWNIAANTIGAIGEGGNGAHNATVDRPGAGGGGGAWQRITNLSDAAGTVETTQIGSGGQGLKTFLKTTTTLAADFGTNAATVTNGTGGLVANCFPTTGGSAGGNGGLCSNTNFVSGGGGGGAGGQVGDGKAGAAGNTSTAGGGGGGGANGGSSTAGSQGVTTHGVGGAGGAGTGGTGGGTGSAGSSLTSTAAGGAGTAGTGAGGGGSGGCSAGSSNTGTGGAGATDTSGYDGVHGPGGGGGGSGAANGTGDNSGQGGAGAVYGGGGGGTGGSTGTNGALGAGAAGLIVVTYTPVSTTVNVDDWYTIRVNQTSAALGPFPSGHFTYPYGVVTGEVVLLDKWAPSYPSGPWSAKSVIANGAPAAYDFGVFTLETIRVDKWQPRYPDIIFPAKRPVDTGLFTYPFGLFTKEDIKLDKWAPHYPDQYLRAQRPVDTGASIYPFGIVTAEVTRADKWQPHFPDIVFRPLPIPQQGQQLYPLQPPAVAEIITIDKWQPHAPDIIFRALVPPQQGRQVYPLQPPVEIITVDKWQSHYPDGPWSAKSVIANGWSAYAFGIATGENVLIDKWQPRYPDRHMRAARAVDTGYFTLGQPETVTVDKWFSQQPRPLAARVLNTPAGVVEPLTIPTPNVSAWEPWPVNQYLAPRPVFYDSTVNPPRVVSSPEIITVDKWSPSFVSQLFGRSGFAALFSQSAMPPLNNVPVPPPPSFGGSPQILGKFHWPKIKRRWSADRVEKAIDWDAIREQRTADIHQLVNGMMLPKPAAEAADGDEQHTPLATAFERKADPSDNHEIELLLLLS